MKLDDNQKELVQKIKNREITDVLSFVKYYNLGYEISADKSDIEKQFEELYKDKTYICDKRSTYCTNEYIINEIDRTTIEVKPRLSFQHTNVAFGMKDFPYTFNYFKKVYVTEEINKIISFIALWNYLKEQALVIELPKTCSEEDMALFIRKEAKKETYKVIEQDAENKMDYSDTVVFAADLLDYELVFDDENFEIIIPFLQKKIYPAPELNTFIQKGFNTTEEVNNRNNFLIALAGVIIAIVTSGASIIMTLMDRGYYKELEDINKTLQKQLSSIEIQLDELSNKEYSDSAIIEKIDELIELIEKKIPSQN